MNKFLLLFLLVPAIAFGAGIQPYAVLDSSKNVVSIGYTDQSQSLQPGQTQVAIPGGTPIPDLTNNSVVWSSTGFTITSKTLPADSVGFTQAIKTDLGGILVANALMKSYPAFFPAIQLQNWPDVQTLVIDALNKGVLSAGQYASIKQEAQTYHIPITL